MSSFLDKLQSVFINKKQQKSPVINRLQQLCQAQTMLQPVWTDRSYAKLCREGYSNNVVAYRCVNLIARGGASIPMIVTKDGVRIKDHPLLSLINSPNPYQGRVKLLENILSYILLSGNSYLNLVRDSRGIVAEVYALRPDRMNVIPSSGVFPQAYQYSVDSVKQIYPVDQTSGSSDILHIKSFNPLNDWYGMSPLAAAAKSIDQHNAVAGHNLALLQNGGRPTGVLMIGRKKGNNLTQEQRDELRSYIEQTHNIKSKTGRFLVLEGDMEWKEMGLSPKDLDFVEGKKLTAREIAQAYGVPPTLVGVPGDATFANYKEARYHLWEDTIIPLMEGIITEFNRGVAKDFGDNIKLELDLDNVAALAPKREKLWARIEGASFLSMEEKRQLLGFPPTPKN